MLFKPVTRLGHTVIRNKNNKAEEQRHTHGRGEKETQTFYIDVSSILFTYNGNDLFSSWAWRSGQAWEERKRDGVSARGEKKFKMP